MGGEGGEERSDHASCWDYVGAHDVGIIFAFDTNPIVLFRILLILTLILYLFIRTPNTAKYRATHTSTVCSRVLVTGETIYIHPKYWRGGSV